MASDKAANFIWDRGTQVYQQLKEVRAENERLRAALKPFAAVAKHYAPYPADMTDKTVDYPFKLADLRAAEIAFNNEQLTREG